MWQRAIGNTPSANPELRGGETNDGVHDAKALVEQLVLIAAAACD
jgi:hypothetical protein